MCVLTYFFISVTILYWNTKITTNTEASVLSPNHTRTNSSASSASTTHSCATSPTPSTSSVHSPSQLISPSHSRENSLTGTHNLHMPLPDVTLNNARNNVWTNSRALENKMLQLESDCFKEATRTTPENDKENTRLIMNAKETENIDESILLRTLDGKLVKSVQPPGKGKPIVFKVRFSRFSKRFSFILTSCCGFLLNYIVQIGQYESNVPINCLQ